jgi:hypothetical protein
MIEANINTLQSQIEKNGLLSSVVMRARENGEFVGPFNILLNKDSGEIIDIAYKVQAVKNTIVLHVALRCSADRSSFLLELLDQESRLPDKIRSVVIQSIFAINSSK